MEIKKSTMKYGVIYLLIELGLILIIALVWWLRGGQSVVYLSNLLFLGGFGVMLIGVLVMVGSIWSTGNFNYQFSKSVNPEAIEDRTARDVRERFKTQYSMLRFVYLGLPLVVLGVLVHLIWG